MLENASDKKSNAKNGELNGPAGPRSLPLKGNFPPASTEQVDIYNLLDQLEGLLEKSKRLPMHTLVGFDEDQFYYLVLKIRANLPDDMKKAQRVARDSERIVDEARDAATQQLESGRVEANRVVADAKADAERMVEEARSESLRIIEQARAQAAQMVERSEIMQMATAQAHDTIRRSETEANEIRKGADDYARDVLTALEGQMNKALTAVQRGKDMLDSSRTNVQ